MPTSAGDRLFIGTSGFRYDHWKPEFYPADLPGKQWFDYYARHFRTVEINNTLYGLPKPDTFIRWREQAPAGFRFALKFSHFGSHIKRLKDPDDTIGRYTPQLLSARARQIADWLRQKRQVFTFFNNNTEACAIKDAFKLKEYVERKLKA